MGTFYSTKDAAYFLFSNADYAPYTGQFEFSVEAGFTNTKNLGAVWDVNTDNGTRSGELTFSGWQDSVMSQYKPAGGYSPGKPLSILLEGNTVGKRFYGFQSAFVKSQALGLGPDTVNTESTPVTLVGEVNHGWVVAPLTARTTNGNTNATECDTGTAHVTGHGFLHINAISGGATGVTVTIQHSEDHETWADHTSFTKTGAVGAEVKALAGDVYRYLSIKWVWDGGTNPSFTGFVGIAFD